MARAKLPFFIILVNHIMIPSPKNNPFCYNEARMKSPDRKLLSLRRNKTSFALAILLILGIVALFLSDLPAHAQDAPPTSETERPFLPTAHFRHLTTADGLPVNTIDDIYQDSRGFIWIATTDGLAQYDGYTVTTYKHDPENDNSLSHNHVQAIVEDENGRLWLATEGGGVNSYDPVTNRFTRYPYAPDTPGSFIGSTVLTAFKDNHNNIWFGSPPPFGIGRMNTVTGETAQYFQEEGIDGLAWGGIVDQQGDLWIITDRDLNRYNPQSDTFTSYPVPIRDDHLTDITQTEDGRLWISGMDGLYAFDPQNEDLSSVGEFYAIKAMQLVDNGRLWIGTHYEVRPHLIVVG